MKKLSLVVFLGVMMTACGTLGMNHQNAGTDDMGRTILQSLNDESIELVARKNLSQIDGIGKNTVRIAIDSFAGEVLLTGEVPRQTIKTNIETMLKSIKDVKTVYNYLTVTDTPKSQSHTVHENYLKSKIAARLITNKGIRASQYKIVVRDRTAYVMGRMTLEQQNYILQAIQNTAGMSSAVTLTTLIDDKAGATNPIQSNITTNQMTHESTDGDKPINTKPDGVYSLQEIYTPNASTNAPTNVAPVYTPRGAGTSGYVQLHQGTNRP